MKWAADSAKFIVRNQDYPQDLTYGDWCCGVVAELSRSPRSSIAEAETIIERALAAKFGGSFGQSRTQFNQGPTPLNEKSDKYARYARDVIERFPEALGSVHASVATDREHIIHCRVDSEEIPLSRLSRYRGNVADIGAEYAGCVEHAPCIRNPREDAGAQKIRRRMEDAFQHLSDPANPAEERRDAALECCYLFSQLMPFARGSATGAMILLEYLAAKVDMPTAYLKEGVDLNMEALTRQWPDFRRAYLSGELADRKATHDAILAWQKAVVAQPKRERSWADIVDDVASVASEGAAVSLHTVKRTVLHYLLHSSPEKDEAHIDIGRNPQGELCVRFTNNFQTRQVMGSLHLLGNGTLVYAGGRTLGYGESVLSRRGPIPAEEFVAMPIAEAEKQLSHLRPAAASSRA